MARIGVISDVHSNVVALKAVLNEFEKRKIDKIICCGDIIGIGPYVDETMQLIMQNQDKIIAVRGNHEQYLIKGLPKEVHDDKRGMDLDEIKNHRWVHSKISEEAKQYICQLPLSREIKIENKRIHIVHYPIDEKGRYKKHIKKATLQEVQKLFEGIDADIFLYGHTHCNCINIDKEKCFINPGTLGCPMATNIANAGILTIDNEVSYEQLKVEYNVEEVINKIESIKFPFYKGILKIFYK